MEWLQLVQRDRGFGVDLQKTGRPGPVHASVDWFSCRWGNESQKMVQSGLGGGHEHFTDFDCFSLETLNSSWPKLGVLVFSPTPGPPAPLSTCLDSITLCCGKNSTSEMAKNSIYYVGHPARAFLFLVRNLYFQSC